jgi:vancomycin resistance protein YoaR
VLLLLSVAERAYYSGRVLPGVRVDGVNVANQREGAAYADIARLARHLRATPVRVRVGAKEVGVDPALLGLTVDAHSTVRAARKAGRSRNPFEQITGTVLRRFRDDDVPLHIHYDDRQIDAVLDGLASATTTGLVEGGLRFEGATVVPIQPRAGVGIRPDVARERLRQALGRAERPVVTLPMGTVQPQVGAVEVELAATRARKLLTGNRVLTAESQQLTISPAHLATALTTRVVDHRLDLVVDPLKLRTALGATLAPLEVPPVDASFVVAPDNTVHVVPSHAGREIDMAAVARAIIAGQRSIAVSVREMQPAHDTKWAQRLGITRQVSSFTTYHPAGAPRVHNIHVAAGTLNNTVVEPGQVFSLNGKLGKRTPDKGYVKAPVIGDNEFVEDYGGGVSQLTTTLYNAVFFGGYQDVEHTPHSIYISRYPMGREATINYGVTDLKFRDDTSHGVLIRTSYTDSSITVTFYGDNDGRVVRETGRRVLAVEPIKDELINCPAKPDVDTNHDCDRLTAFQTKQIADGHTGYTVEFTQVIDQPGRPEVRHHYRWRYLMFTNKVLVGTRPPPASATTTSAPPASSTSAPPTTAPHPPPTTLPHP